MKLAETGVLSSEILEMLLVAVLKSPSPQCAVEAVTCATTVINHSEMHELSGPVLTLLQRQRPVEDLLLAAGAHVDVATLACLFVSQLVEDLPMHDHAAADLCRAIASGLPVVAAVPALVRRALTFVIEDPAAPKAFRVRLADVVAVCVEHFARESDAAIRDVLAGLSERSAGKASVFALLAVNSSVTMRHMPLDDVGVTFLLALEHEDFQVSISGTPQPSRPSWSKTTAPFPCCSSCPCSPCYIVRCKQVRIRAVDRAITLSAEGGVAGDMHAAVLRRLDDDHPSVVAALSKGATLLAQCSPDPGARLSLLWRTFRRCSNELWCGSVVHASAVAAMLVLLRLQVLAGSGSDSAHAAAVLAHLEHLPSRVGARLRAHEAVEALGREAVGGARELASAGALCELFGSIAGVKKGTLPSVNEVSDLLAKHLSMWSSDVAAGAQKNCGGLSLAPAVRIVLLDATSASTRLHKADVSMALKVLLAVLPELHVLAEKAHPQGVHNSRRELQIAIVDVLSAVVACAPQGHESMNDVFGHILRLPAAVFWDSKVQTALQQIVGHHFKMAPLCYTASIYAAPFVAALGASAEVGRIRALGISKTFVLALGAGNVPKGTAEAALSDVFSTLPHVFSCLEHKEQAIRDASLGLLAAVCDCAQLDALTASTASLVPALSTPGAPGVPALKASDMFKLCGTVCGRKAEISMDARNLGPCFSDLFVHEPTDRYADRVKMLLALCASILHTILHERFKNVLFCLRACQGVEKGTRRVLQVPRCSCSQLWFLAELAACRRVVPRGSLLASRRRVADGVERARGQCVAGVRSAFEPPAFYGSTRRGWYAVVCNRLFCFGAQRRSRGRAAQAFFGPVRGSSLPPGFLFSPG